MLKDHLPTIQVKVPFVLGVVLISIGFFCNEWVLTKAFSSDGLLELSTKGMVWLFDAMCILAGILLIRHRQVRRKWQNFLALTSARLSAGSPLELRESIEAQWPLIAKLSSSRHAHLLAIALMVIAAGGYLCLRFLLIRDRYYDQDELCHLHAAWCMAQGQTLYKDFFALHGPLLYFLLSPVTAFVNDPIAAVWTGRGLMAVFWGGMLLLQWHLAPFHAWSRWERLTSILLLASFTTFANKSMEIRPDVPAAFLFSVMLVLGTRAPSKGKSFFLGLLMGLAAFFSLKIIYCCSGFWLGYLFVHGKKLGVRRLLTTMGVWPLLVGCLIPVASVLTYFLMRHASKPFWECYGLFNFHFRQLYVPGSMFLERTLRQNPLLWVFGVVGAYLGRKDGVLLFSFVTTLVAAMLTPSPYEQHYLFLAAPLSYLATLTCAALFRTLARLMDWRLWAVGALAASLLLAGGFVQQLQMLKVTNQEQIAQIRCVMLETKPTDLVFDFWTGYAFYRPHACQHWFLPMDITLSIGRERVREEITHAWENNACRALIWDDWYFDKAFPTLKSSALTHFRPTNCRSLYVRRTSEIPLG